MWPSKVDRIGLSFIFRLWTHTEQTHRNTPKNSQNERNKIKWKTNLPRTNNNNMDKYTRIDDWLIYARSIQTHAHKKDTRNVWKRRVYRIWLSLSCLFSIEIESRLCQFFNIGIVEVASWLRQTIVSHLTHTHTYTEQHTHDALIHINRRPFTRTCLLLST